MKVLLAEDDKQISSAVKQILEMSGFEVIPVFDGQSAFELVSKTNFDAVILDVMMPKMNGFDVLKSIRENENEVPILMLTALSQIDDKVHGLDSGADDYLPKPFEAKELVARVKALTRRKKQETKVLNFENLSLNPNTFEISASKTLQLTNKEFKILLLLLNSQNMLMSTESLMEKVWGYDSESELNVVWVFISGLRKKLEKIGANCTIKAVRGVGYKLEKL